MMSGVVIIGAGECGVRAAFALREHGYKGELTLIGAEAALPYERPPLSKAGEIRLIRTAEAYSDNQIALRLGKVVTNIDFGSRLVFLSGGEALARKAGAEVTVIEAGPRLLGRAVPPQIARVLQERHSLEGVSLMLDTGVVGASANQIVLADGTLLEFDAVIAGVGSLPETALAEAAGLAVRNGIAVDGDFRTSAPQVFAAGDCCNFDWRGQQVRLESWKAAQDQGEHVALSILGRSVPYNKVQWFWSDQYDLSLQVAGIFDLGAPIHSRATGDGTTVVFQCDAQQNLVAAAGIGPGNATSKDIRIFEKLIERQTIVDAGRLADPSQNLKRLLAAT